MHRTLASDAMSGPKHAPSTVSSSCSADFTGSKTATQREGYDISMCTARVNKTALAGTYVYTEFVVQNRFPCDSPHALSCDRIASMHAWRSKNPDHGVCIRSRSCDTHRSRGKTREMNDATPVSE